jgi:hypothetical protein
MVTAGRVEGATPAGALATTGVAGGRVAMAGDDGGTEIIWGA